MKDHLRLQITLFLIAFISVSFTASHSRAEPILIRFSHVVGENTPKGMGASMFKSLVEQRLGGRVVVEIYAQSQKFTDEQALLGLLFGDVEMAAPSFPKFRKFSKRLQIFDLPFLFENTDEIHKFQKSQEGQQLLSSMEDLGIKGLRYWDNGMRIISATKPIKTPYDLKGLILRIESSCIFQNQYSRLGAIAIPMPFKRLKDSLREGVVDGYENAWSNVLSNDLHLLRPYFTETGHSYLGYMLVTSKEFWDNLPPDISSELNTILDEVTVEVNRLAVEKASKDKSEILKNKNVQVVTLTESDKEAWRQVLLPTWRQYESEIGVELIELAKKAKANK